MGDERHDEGTADELLRRALLDATDAAAVSLAVGDLPLSDVVTVVFHGRRDLGTIQTYVARGRFGAGATLSARDLMRVPCDLDLGDAEDREQAEELYLQQARALRPDLDDMGRVFGMGPVARLRHIVLPQLAPAIAAAARSGDRPPISRVCPAAIQPAPSAAAIVPLPMIPISISVAPSFASGEAATLGAPTRTARCASDRRRSRAR